ncbi:MAG TPA: hypothetical protein VLV15_02485, partial [Dongiaceae bacterium]|nr:hypothetical protein [Dongiaceae bacterium]
MPPPLRLGPHLPDAGETRVTLLHAIQPHERGVGLSPRPPRFGMVVPMARPRRVTPDRGRDPAPRAGRKP